jgi:hypothetical protein
MPEDGATCCRATTRAVGLSISENARSNFARRIECRHGSEMPTLTKKVKQPQNEREEIGLQGFEPWIQNASLRN